MGSIKINKYPAYKSSGVDWLEEIPEHWEIKKLKHIFYEKKKSTNVELSCGSISFGKVVYKDDERIPEATKKSYQVVSNGDFLINPLNLNYDLISLRIALSVIDVVVSSGYIVINNQIEINKSYYKWLLHRYDVAYMKLLGSGVRQTINFNHIANSILAFPPLPEQTAIADFLDRKTVLIDKAIGIKERQIELLKERRQILIHKAVTRGLDPNVKMKDCGIEWIGEIPESWEGLTKMKFISSLKGRQGWQGLKAEEYKYEGPHVLSSAHFNNYIIDWDKCPRVSIERYLMDEHIQLNIGDILLMKDGANMGKLALVENLPGLACLNSHLLLFRSLKINGVSYYWPKFMFYHMMCQEFQDYVKVNGTGSTFLGISQESIGNYPICLPLIEEQKLIAKFLDEKYSKFDWAISLKEKEIEKLKEYKSTLINSVVTGKIKVN
jgi:type I restriction enzyme, S subunit